MFGKEKKTDPAETAAGMSAENPAGEDKAFANVAAPAEPVSLNVEDAGEQPAPEAEDPLARAAKDLEEAQNKLLYLQADYQNYRRRMIKELSDARQMGVIGTLDPFLRVADFLGMADTAARQSDNLDAIRQGLAMIINEFNRAFDDLGVKKESAVGKTFDPDKQEAFQQEASETVPEGVVIRELYPAYMMGDRCIRAAKVVVSTGKPAPAPEPAPEEPAEKPEA